MNLSGPPPKRRLDLETRECLILRHGLVGVAVSTVGTYSSSAFEAAQISESHFSTTAHTQVYSGNTHKHSLSCSVVSKQGGLWQSLGTVNHLWGTGWTCNQGLSWEEGGKPLQKPEHETYLIQFALPLMTWAESLHGPHLLQHFPALGQSSWCGEAGEKKKKNTVSSGQPNPQGFYSSNLW